MSRWNWELAYWWFAGHLMVLIGLLVFDFGVPTIVIGAVVSSLFLAWRGRDQ